MRKRVIEAQDRKPRAGKRERVIESKRERKREKIANFSRFLSALYSRAEPGRKFPFNPTISSVLTL